MFCFVLTSLFIKLAFWTKRDTVDTTAYRILLFLDLENILFDSIRVSNNYLK